MIVLIYILFLSLVAQYTHLVSMILINLDMYLLQSSVFVPGW